MVIAEGLRSEDRYGFTSPKEKDDSEVTESAFDRTLQTAWDAIIEYPGSKENHEWFFVSWVEEKLLKVVRAGNGRA